MQSLDFGPDISLGLRTGAQTPILRNLNFEPEENIYGHIDINTPNIFTSLGILLYEFTAGGSTTNNSSENPPVRS